MNDLPRKIERKMTLHINVDSPLELPKTGRHVADFLKRVDHDHGPFDVKIEINVSPEKTPRPSTVITNNTYNENYGEPDDYDEGEDVH